ncbi:hypothetical protein KUTeg_008054 [Tegillarca granosa]|uniref:Uncharacterized protein n=1 Tax=Tegillarca granosa TaxID=220873 RepID=A0ABQ9F7Z8_TEGGR|nr:hypothetical protein KUTeg_008054 [Tegillarca granosa]
MKTKVKTGIIGFALSKLKTKYIKEWRKIIAKHPLTTPKIRCNTAYPYRTADGSCNNLRHVMWGKSDTIEPRYLDPDYEDGKQYGRL